MPQKFREIVSISGPTRILELTWTTDPPQDGECQVTVRRVGDTQLVAVGHHIPPVSSPDFARFSRHRRFCDFDALRDGGNQRNAEILDDSMTISLTDRLSPKSVAAECAEWLKNKAEIRSMVKPNFLHGKLYLIENANGVKEGISGNSNFASLIIFQDLVKTVENFKNAVSS